jgi:hypothetical protein
LVLRFKTKSKRSHVTALGDYLDSFLANFLLLNYLVVFLKILFIKEHEIYLLISYFLEIHLKILELKFFKIIADNNVGAKLNLPPTISYVQKVSYSIRPGFD